MRSLLIAVSAAAAAPGAHAGAAYPEGCFSAPVCVTVERTQATLDFNFESLADQPYTVAVSSSQHGLGAELAEILLLQLDPQNLDEYMSGLFVMLGYGLALGAMVAMPWLAPGTASEAGAASVLSWSFWREPVVRYVRWLATIAAILLLWC